MQRLALAAAVIAASVFSFACHKEKAPAAAAGLRAGASPEIPPDTVVAIVKGEKITAAQLDEVAGPQIKQLEKKKFEVRRDTLDQMINEKVVKAEIARKGQTEQQFFKEEIEDKVPAPTEEQLQQEFQKLSSSMPPGTTLDAYRPQVTEYVRRKQLQGKAREVFERLRKEAGVEVKFSEPRTQVEAKGPARGPENAKVTIVEFSDFECPFCGQAHDTIEQVMQSYAGKVRLVFRQFPLGIHPHAPKAAEAALCADEQKRFWEYHDTLFKNQHSLEVPQLKEHAKAVGLDEAQFAQCLDSGKFAQKVKDDMSAGTVAGVTGTPAFFINGIPLSGAQPLDQFSRVIDQELGG